MKKLSLIFALLLIVVIGYAEKTVNHVESDQGSLVASDPEDPTGWYETNTGYSANFMGSLITVPAGTTRVDILLDTPVLTSFTVTANPQANLVSGSASYICVAGRQGSVQGTVITISGYCTATGRNITRTLIVR